MSQTIIHYHCKGCNTPLDILPDFAKYFLEYMAVEKRATLTCPECDTLIPVKRLYNKWQKSLN